MSAKGCLGVSHKAHTHSTGRLCASVERVAGRHGIRFPPPILGNILYVVFFTRMFAALCFMLSLVKRQQS